MKILQYISKYGFIGDEKILFNKLQNEGTVLLSCGWEGGYGHHSVAAIVLYNDKFYAIESSGCSCEVTAYVSEPFDTKEKAILNLSDYNRTDLIEGEKDL